MSTDESSAINERVDALTRIAKNNAVADEDLASFFRGIDGSVNPLPNDQIHRAKTRDAFAKVVGEIIDDGCSYASPTHETMEAALCSLGFLLGFHIPPPLSQRRVAYAERSGLSNSTIIRREREASRLIAEQFDEYVRRPKRETVEDTDKARALRALIQRSPLGADVDGDDLLKQALQVIEYYEGVVRDRDSVIRQAIGVLNQQEN